MKEPKIVEKEKLNVVGMKVTTDLKNNRIPALWDEFCPRMKEIKNVKYENVAVGVCPYIPMEAFSENTKFDYYAGLIVDNFSKVPSGMVKYGVPAGKYLVFTHRGSLENLNRTYKTAMQWLQTSEHERTEAPELEWYDERFNPEDSASELDILIPIK